MTIHYAKRHRTAVLVFDLEDKFARDRRLSGPHPRPFGPIRFYLLGASANGGQPQSFEGRWEMLMQLNPSGYHLFFDFVKSPSSTKWQARLPAGDYLVRIESRYYRPIEETVRFPAPRDPGVEIDVEQIDFPSRSVDLLPGHNYPFPQLNGMPGPHAPTLLRGAIPEIAGLDLSGIKVSAQANAEADTPQDYQTFITDEAGQWVLVFPQARSVEKVTLRFFLPNIDEGVELSDITIKPGWQNTMSRDRRKELKDKLEGVLPLPG